MILQKIFAPVLLFVALPVSAQEVILSSPLPGTQQSVSGIGQYIETAFPFFLTVVAGLALVYITWGGILYATSLSSDRKQVGKDHIINAIIGLVLAFLAVLILSTINPNLVNLSLPGIGSGGGDGGGGTPSQTVPGTAGWECDPNAQSGEDYSCADGLSCVSLDHGAASYTCEEVSGVFGEGRCERDPNGFPINPDCEDPLPSPTSIDPELIRGDCSEAIELQCLAAGGNECVELGGSGIQFASCLNDGRVIGSFPL